MSDLSTIHLNTFVLDTSTSNISFTTSDGKNSHFNHNVRAEDFVIVNGSTGQETSLLNFINGGGGGGDSNGFQVGKYSQVCLPGNGQISIDGGVNEDENTPVSIIGGASSRGSLVFSPSELSEGSSYHTKIGGTIQTDTKNMELNISFVLNGVDLNGEAFSDLIFTTELYGDEFKLDRLDVDYTYECEVDFSVYGSGATRTIYSNGQLVYVSGTGKTDLKGLSTEMSSEVDLTNPVTLDILMKWNSVADVGETVTNKMVRVNRLF